MTLELLTNEYSVYKYEPDHIVDINIRREGFFSATRTGDELSIVAPENTFDDFISEEAGWKILKISGTLDFSLIGVLSKISAVLANAHISIFVISTYNTDYIMVKKESINKATEALRRHEYEVKE